MSADVTWYTSSFAMKLYIFNQRDNNFIAVRSQALDVGGNVAQPTFNRHTSLSTTTKGVLVISAFERLLTFAILKTEK